MAEQNLISATVSPEDKADILQKLKDIKEKLNFLISLQPDEIKSLIKMGNSYLPFVDKAHEAVTAHPEIMPGTFDLEEFKRDYSLTKDLIPIMNEVNALAEGLQNTMMAVRSDAMNSSLEIYGAVKSNVDRIPGLNVTAGEMSDFFKKAKRKSKD